MAGVTHQRLDCTAKIASKRSPWLGLLPERDKMKNIHIEYRWEADKFPSSVSTERFYVSGPIIALNHFHRTMQRKREMKDDRKTVIRPKLLPEQYAILRCYETYLDNLGVAIKSDYDMPATANPDVSVKKKNAMHELPSDELFVLEDLV